MRRYITDRRSTLSKMLLAMPLVLLSVSCSNRTLVQGLAENADLITSALQSDRASVAQHARKMIAASDQKAQIAPAGSALDARLQRIVGSLPAELGMPLNFKVYMDDEIQAFAAGDGSVRVYSGLLNRMSDDQVLAVVGHEIGHVHFQHSAEHLRQAILAEAARRGVASLGGGIGSVANSEVGQLGKALITAQYSQDDELESDRFAISVLHRRGLGAQSMIDALKVIKDNQKGAGGGFLSSHPATSDRINALKRL